MVYMLVVINRARVHQSVQAWGRFNNMQFKHKLGCLIDIIPKLGN
jgi:hypothetical protein